MKRQHLVDARKRYNWSQAQVAQAIGMTKSAYANIETGRRAPSLAKALQLQTLLNHPIDYLLAQDSDQDQNTTPRPGAQEAKEV